MKIPFNNKKEIDFSEIFSQIKDDEYLQGFSKLQNNLSKLQHNMTLLNLYGTKTKIHSKRKKDISTPKKFQTEPSKTFKSLTRSKKKKNFEYQIDNTKEVNQSPINEMAKTSLNNKNSKQNIFMTNINYKNKIKNFNINLNNTNYKFSNSTKYKKNKLGFNTIDYNLFTLDNNSFIKTKFNSKNKNNSSKRISNYNIDKEQFPKITNNMIKNIKKENNNIKNTIYKGIEKFNIMEWYMKTRFK